MLCYIMLCYVRLGYVNSVQQIRVNGVQRHKDTLKNETKIEEGY